jgi:hypothetical protein
MYLVLVYNEENSFYNWVATFALLYWQNPLFVSPASFLFMIRHFKKKLINFPALGNGSKKKFARGIYSRKTLEPSRTYIVIKRIVHEF